ncbi:hypothetical protein P0L94_15930 [Microbacter sp. GSS18]|nr:hypothetical protein P0L94_15930 [Microbacter sp. GSS18]
MNAKQHRTAVILIGALLTAFLASLLLAPLVSVRGCAASEDSLDPLCKDFSPQSVFGFDTNIWVWAASLIAIAVAAGWLIWRSDRPGR